jgi:AcrR family transcriptional regulator
VSIRAVSERVGVTPPSIYLHFPDKEALLSAVCEVVFADLDAAMEAAAAGAASAFEALRERGLAYVRFAIANPEHYRIVLMRRYSIEMGDADLAALSERGAFAHLLDSVRGCQAEGVFRRDDDAVQIALALWAAAHGAAALLIARPWIAADGGVELATRVIDAIGLGLARA